MSDKDYIKELFKSKLEAFESPVDSAMWSAVQSQLPSVAAKGLSVAAKVIIGLSSAAVVSTVALVALNSNSNDKEEPKKQQVEQTQSDYVENQDKTPENTETNGTPKQNGSKIAAHASDNQEQGNQPDEGAENNRQDLVMEWPIKLDVERLTQEDKLIPDPKQETIAEATNRETLGSSEKGTENKKNEQKEEETPTTTPESNLPEIQKLVLPDIFTPNGDMRNDELFVESKNLHDFSLVVLNARNQVVFKTNDPDFKWNAYDLYGNPVPDGDYMYIVTALDEFNRPVNASNRLRIVR